MSSVCPETNTKLVIPANARLAMSMLHTVRMADMEAICELYHLGNQESS
ncbi:MAG: hypothetical protein R3C28_15470 [Pirellulaceae bacterium]